MKFIDGWITFWPRLGFRHWPLLLALACHVLAQAEAHAQESQNLNIPLPTMGGQQLWTDHRWAAGWRMQRNAWTDHWRVLDNSDVRRAWGSREACLAKLNEHQAQADTPPAEAVVILLHGLMRTNDSMQPLAKAFQKSGRWQPICVSYASTRDTIEHHAWALRELVDNLPGKPRVAFVGHSLGNIVVRRALGLWQEDDLQGVLPRIERVVMLGPPNQGSALARQLSGLGVFEVITGASGQELGRVWEDLQSKLATPTCPFCIVAGELSENAWLKNPLLEGKGDFVVTVEETKLEGAAKTIVLPVLHSYLMSDQRAIQATLEFVEQPAEGR